MNDEKKDLEAQLHKLVQKNIDQQMKFKREQARYKNQQDMISAMMGMVAAQVNAPLHAFIADLKNRKR